MAARKVDLIAPKAHVIPMRLSVPAEKATQPSPETDAAKMSARGVDAFYGPKQALFGINLDIRERAVTALIGPSGCGKSTFLRCLNRMNDTIEGAVVKGHVDARRRGHLRPRRRRGQPARPRRHGVPEAEPVPEIDLRQRRLRARASTASRATAPSSRISYAPRSSAPGCSDEVKDRLHEPGTGLSGGQQQRLCIARAIAIGPEVILMDEPCSALDPIATAHIEELIDELRENYTIVIVTHNMQQAARVSQYTAFFHLGELVEFGDTETIFTTPKDERTQDYITGRYG